MPRPTTAFRTIASLLACSLAAFTLGLRSTWFQPFFDALREMWHALRARLQGGAAPDPLSSGWLSEAVVKVSAFFVGIVLFASMSQLLAQRLASVCHGSSSNLVVVASAARPHLLEHGVAGVVGGGSVTTLPHHFQPRQRRMLTPSGAPPHHRRDQHHTSEHQQTDGRKVDRPSVNGVGEVGGRDRQPLAACSSAIGAGTMAEDAVGFEEDASPRAGFGRAEARLGHLEAPVVQRRTERFHRCVRGSDKSVSVAREPRASATHRCCSRTAP